MEGIANDLVVVVVVVVVVVNSVTICSSSVSAGGVAGVTTGFTGATATGWVLLSSSTAAHFAHSSCLRYMYCCCGPTTLPGRTIRMKAIASVAVKLYFHTRYAPISVPVRPKPALHCPRTSEDKNEANKRNLRGQRRHHLALPPRRPCQGIYEQSRP